MEKALNYAALLIKALTIILGGLTATDASLLHLTTGALGTIVGGLGTAGLVVHTMQAQAATKAAADGAAKT